MARPTGAVIKTNNTSVKSLLKGFDDIIDIQSYNELIPSWIDDCISGATGQFPGTKRVSTYRIFRMLRDMDFISTTEVGEAMNPKRLATEGKPYSKSMLEYYTRALRCASQAITHHSVKYLVDEETGEVQDATPAILYTEEQKAKMRKLAIEGSTQELQDFVNFINAKNEDI